jgi:hypothetical protein
MSSPLTQDEYKEEKDANLSLDIHELVFNDFCKRDFIPKRSFPGAVQALSRVLVARARAW